MKAQRGSRGLALLILDPDASWGWVVSTTPRLLYPREREPIPILQEARCSPGPVWKGAENLAPTGIRSPDQQIYYYYYCVCVMNMLVKYRFCRLSTSWTVRGSNPAGARFSVPFQTGPGAHPAFCAMGTGSSRGQITWGVILTTHFL